MYLLGALVCAEQFFFFFFFRYVILATMVRRGIHVRHLSGNTTPVQNSLFGDEGLTWDIHVDNAIRLSVRSHLSNAVFWHTSTLNVDFDYSWCDPARRCGSEFYSCLLTQPRTLSSLTSRMKTAPPYTVTTFSAGIDHLVSVQSTQSLYTGSWNKTSHAGRLVGLVGLHSVGGAGGLQIN